MRAPHKGTEAFLRMALEVETDDCILWPYSVDSCGYGQARVKGTNITAHRAICMMAHGKPPFFDAQAAHYKCGNTRCINKRHIRWSTVTTNHDDKRRHGTMTQGERHPRARFSEQDVLDIVASPLGPSDLGRKYGCDKAVIHSIKSGKTWSWLTGIQRKAA
jgi:hypothetical protein